MKNGRNTNMYATQKWTPIKIGWNSSIPGNDSILMTPVPALFIQLMPAKYPSTPSLQNYHPLYLLSKQDPQQPIAIKTSKSKCIFQPKDLHPYWSVACVPDPGVSKLSSARTLMEISFLRFFYYNTQESLRGTDRWVSVECLCSHLNVLNWNPTFQIPF